ncbi:hypothetical protein ANN_21245 [Periplaneta americana]|uniref:Transmembrane protein n=1 Tax=Periplaneta americana TaxID=6978 RepID=A0ABQ8SG39_PERAM|nr:hypothetical protein ANN_21245 [Periplaneta americana]
MAEVGMVSGHYHILLSKAMTLTNMLEYVKKIRFINNWKDLQEEFVDVTGKNLVLHVRRNVRAIVISLVIVFFLVGWVLTQYEKNTAWWHLIITAATPVTSWLLAWFFSLTCRALENVSRTIGDEMVERSDLGDSYVWVALDETTNVLGHFIANLVEDKSCYSFVKNELKELGINEEKVLVLYSDAVSYIISGSQHSLKCAKGTRCCPVCTVVQQGEIESIPASSYGVHPSAVRFPRNMSSSEEEEEEEEEGEEEEDIAFYVYLRLRSKSKRYWPHLCIERNVNCSGLTWRIQVEFVMKRDGSEETGTLQFRLTLFQYKQQ